MYFSIACLATDFSSSFFMYSFALSPTQKELSSCDKRRGKHKKKKEEKRVD